MEIKIIETSDMHGCVLPTKLYRKKLMDLKFSTAKSTTVIRQQRKANGPVIQIDRGLPFRITIKPLCSQTDSSSLRLAKVLNYLNYDLGIWKPRV